MKEKKPSFEQALARLEEIVEKLEEGEIGLEDSLAHYREGIGLHKYCAEKLAKVEQELMRVLKEDDEPDLDGGAVGGLFFDTEGEA